MEDIENKMIVKSTRSDIIESVGHQMWIHGTHPSPDEYTDVCRLLIKKFPVLRDTLGNGIVRFITNLLP